MSNSSINNGDTSYAQCWTLIQNGINPQPDNDISGIGIIVAYVVSAYLTFGLIVAAYILGYVDRSLLRPVDTLVHKRIGIRGGRGNASDDEQEMGEDEAAARGQDTWAIMFRQTVLAFSDQQIVTGIAILIAGFARFTTAMSVYHFQMVIFLAWMSSSTHLSALTMLAGFLRERRLLLTWRLVGMLMLFVFLLVALVPTWPNLWAIDITPGNGTTGWGVPAQCFWLRTYEYGVNPDAVLGSAILVASYIWKVGSLFHSTRTFFHRWVRGPTEYFLERLVRHEAQRVQQGSATTRFHGRYRMAVALYCMTVSQFEFCSSFAASLWMSLGGLIWGSVQILVPRIQNDWWAWQENAWTFGQVTPLVLLIQPLGSVVEHLHRHRHHRSGPAPAAHAGKAIEMSDIELGSNRRRRDTLRSWGRISRPLRASKRRDIKPARRGSIAGSTTLLSVFAQLEVRRPEDRVIGDLSGHQRIMYKSRYFRGLFWSIQIMALATIGVICGFDGYVIGVSTGDNWVWICVLVFGSVGTNLLWSLLSMPFSRVFK